MKPTKSISLSIILLLLGSISGCQAFKKETYNEKLFRFSQNSDKWVCGKYYGLFFFSGQRDPVSEVDKMVAREVMTTKRINCEKFQDNLEDLNLKYMSIYIKQKEINDRNSRISDLEWEVSRNKKKISDLEFEADQKKIQDSFKDLPLIKPKY